MVHKPVRSPEATIHNILVKNSGKKTKRSMPAFKMEITEHRESVDDEVRFNGQLLKSRLGYERQASRVKPPNHLQLGHRARDVLDDELASNPLFEVNGQPPQSRQIDEKLPHSE